MQKNKQSKMMPDTSVKLLGSGSREVAASMGILAAETLIRAGIRNIYCSEERNGTLVFEQKLKTGTGKGFQVAYFIEAIPEKKELIVFQKTCNLAANCAHSNLKWYINAKNNEQMYRRQNIKFLHTGEYCGMQTMTAGFLEENKVVVETVVLLSLIAAREYELMRRIAEGEVPSSIRDEVSFEYRKIMQEWDKDGQKNGF